MRDQRVLRIMKTPRSSAERPFPTSSAVTCAHTTLRLIEARLSLSPSRLGCYQHDAPLS